MPNLEYMDLLEPTLLYPFITNHDIDLIEQIKSYAHRYIAAFKNAHDNQDDYDDWSFYKQLWGFSFDTAIKEGKVRRNKMYKMANKPVANGNVYFRIDNKPLESWDNIKGRSHLIKYVYIDLRETFLVVGTTNHWLVILNNINQQTLYAAVERSPYTLTQVIEQVRLTGKVDNHGFTS